MGEFDVSKFVEKIFSPFLNRGEHPMIFTEYPFWIFFLVVLAGYSLFHKRLRVRSLFLFLVSIYFYYKTSGFFFSILLFSTILDFVIGERIYRNLDGIKATLWLAVSITVNLTLLVYFKYAYFFADSFNAIFDSLWHPINHFALATNKVVGSTFRVDQILLPIGISFYTFQTMSYAIDIYRKKLKPVSHVIDFAFYVSFFPQLVAGPIVRHQSLYLKFTSHMKSQKRIWIGCFWILNGLLKKFLLADYIAVNFVDRVFDNPSMFSGLENLLALYGYSLQVYADFSGYTDML